jgi:hypothetical protein
MAVRSGIVVAVRFGLDDDAARAVDLELSPDQRARNRRRAAGKERRKRAGRLD